MVKHQPEDRAAASDLDIVRMRSDDQQAEGSFRSKGQALHLAIVDGRSGVNRTCDGLCCHEVIVHRRLSRPGGGSDPP